MTATGGKHKKPKVEKNLDAIFLFGSPALFFRSVEALLLFQCFYISMAATQVCHITITHNLYNAQSHVLSASHTPFIPHTDTNEPKLP